MSAKQKLFAGIRQEIDKILVGNGARDQKLAEICKVLNRQLPHYDWVGFYLVDPDYPRELVLGPFVGAPTEHVRIPFGKGICGQAAESEEVFVVDDVTLETNYLSCSPFVKSEIVLPILRNGEIVGELDIDSHKTGNFEDEDRAFLAELCERLSSIM
ncbi:MAG: GAF domain-containing protein [bacterium]|jgi:GAF domain-containing protein